MLLDKIFTIVLLIASVIGLILLLKIKYLEMYGRKK